MKSFCEKHAFTEMKKRGNQIQILGRVLPSQQLQKDQIIQNSFIHSIY